MLEALTKAIDDVLAVDVQALTDAELHDRTIGLQRLTSAIGGRSSNGFGGGTRRIWAADGSKSAGARLAREVWDGPGDGEVRDPSRPASSAPCRRRLPRWPMAPYRLTTDLLTRANSGDARKLFARDEQLLVNLLQPMRHSTAKKDHRVLAQQRR